MTAHDPAYPCETLQFTPAGYDRHHGLTKRELFAAMAMQGALAGAPGPHLHPYSLANDSVAYADALLAALQTE